MIIALNTDERELLINVLQECMDQVQRDIVWWHDMQPKVATQMAVRYNEIEKLCFRLKQMREVIDQ